jgi:hypothetical protein
VVPEEARPPHLAVHPVPAHPTHTGLHQAAKPLALPRLRASTSHMLRVGSTTCSSGADVQVKCACQWSKADQANPCPALSPEQDRQGSQDISDVRAAMQVPVCRHVNEHYPIQCTCNSLSPYF